LACREVKKKCLLLLFPHQKVPVEAPSESSLIGKEPNPKRKQQLIKLIEILEVNAKKSKANNSTAYSYIAWNQIKTVFNPTNYFQPRQNIKHDQMSFLAQYLSITTKCFRNITTRKEAKHLYFLAPVLMYVCLLFHGDVEIVVKEDLVWGFVKAHDHFKYMLRH
jgi:hypothetical protein